MVFSEKAIIAVDAMGGDKAPRITMEGIAIALEDRHDVFFRIFGNKNILKKYLGELPKDRYELIHVEDAIHTKDSVSSAIRSSKNTSMRAAIEDVKSYKSRACVSAGNTGALMALSKIILKPLESIDRPAICTTIPTSSGPCVLLDMGANIHCNADTLLQFAIMGDAFFRVAVNSKKDPKIAILNIGSEDTKGHDILKKAHDLIRASHLSENFVGYIEADKIFFPDGEPVDVVVTDGFTGNVLIKTAEGTSRMIKKLLEQSFTKTVFSKIGYLLSNTSIKSKTKIVDPNTCNGALFIGLNGISVKSHGGASAEGFANALDVTTSLVKNKINEQIIDQILKFSDLQK